VTTITIERELLWQALDALETCAGAPCVDRAKNAVREYLALPAPDDRHALRVIKQMDGYTPGEGWTPLYSQDQVDKAVDAALERAAEVCETILDELSFANAYECANECAEAIRALKDKK